MSDEQESGPVYSDPPTKAWAEEAQSEDYVAPTVKKHGEDQELSKDGFINVGAEYRNYANETDKPLVAEGGPEADIELRHLDDDYDPEAGKTADGEAESDDGSDDEDESGSQAPSSSGGGSFTPPPSGPTP